MTNLKISELAKSIGDAMLGVSQLEAFIAKSGLKIVSFSDVHLGHPNTEAAHIVSSLDRMFPDNAEFGTIDIIFIPGDLLDRQQLMSDEAVLHITGWMCRFLRQCKKWNVVLRVLEGTPSHDWRQSRLFTHLNEIAAIDCDIRFVQTLSIEYIEPFGMHVLYIPDEWNPSCDTTWLQVVELLKSHSLDKVDMVCMHGAFPHQMAKHLHHHMELHNPERYLSICRYWILVGHIHQFSQYERILSAGSTDRLCHGEEGRKGYIQITMTAKDSEVLFIENRNAKRYVTVDCTDMDAEAALAKVEKQVAKLPRDSHVRIRGKRTDPTYSGLDTLKMLYPYFHWTVIETKARKEDESPIGLTDRRRIGARPSLTRDNLPTQLMERVASKFPTVSGLAESLLKDLIDARSR